MARARWLWFAIAWACMGVPAAANDPGLGTALSALRRDDVGGALDGVKAYLERHPDDVEANELLIDILTGLGLGQDAAVYYAERAQLEPRDAMLQYLKGRAATSASSSSAAYLAALALDPRYGRAKMGLAALARANADLTAAATLYEEALALDPTLTEAWAGWVQVEVQRNERARATEVARRSLSAVPQSPDPYLILAALRPLEAIDLLERGTAAVPDEPKVWVALARARLERQDFEAAAVAYSAASRITDADPHVRIERGVTAEVVQKQLAPQSALAFLQARADASATSEARLQRLDALVAANPRSAWLRLARGNLLVELARHDLAEKDLEAALALDAASSDAAASLGLLRLAQGRPDDAARLLAAAIEVQRKDPSLALAHATAILQAQGPAAGERALREAMARFPFEPKIPVVLARLYVQSGNLVAAYQALEATAQRSPSPDVLLAWVEVAERAGRTADEARILDLLAATTGDPRFGARAAELRKSSSKGRSP